MGTEAFWVPLVLGVATAALAPKPPKAAEPAAPPAPVAPPQASTAPVAATYEAANANAALSAGPSSTLLTGPSGVSSDSLDLGKNTLLGA